MREAGHQFLRPDTESNEPGVDADPKAASHPLGRRPPCGRRTGRGWVTPSGATVVARSQGGHNARARLVARAPHRQVDGASRQSSRFGPERVQAGVGVRRGPEPLSRAAGRRGRGGAHPASISSGSPATFTRSSPATSSPVRAPRQHFRAVLRASVTVKNGANCASAAPANLARTVVDCSPSTMVNTSPSRCRAASTSPRE